MSQMDMSGWLRTAVAGIRFKPDREAVERELRAHPFEIQNEGQANLRGTGWRFPDLGDGLRTPRP